MSLQCIYHSYTSSRLSQEIKEEYYKTCDLFLENKINEVIQQTGEKLLICEYAYNKLYANMLIINKSTVQICFLKTTWLDLFRALEF